MIELRRESSCSSRCYNECVHSSTTDMPSRIPYRDHEADCSCVRYHLRNFSRRLILQQRAQNLIFICFCHKLPMTSLTNTSSSTDFLSRLECVMAKRTISVSTSTTGITFRDTCLDHDPRNITFYGPKLLA